MIDSDVGQRPAGPNIDAFEDEALSANPLNYNLGQKRAVE